MQEILKCKMVQNSNNKFIISAQLINQLFLCFQIIRNLTKHMKINNMRFMTLLMIYHFIQVQSIKRYYLTKYGYFSKQEKFIMIY
jgi:hypothetical protein